MRALLILLILLVILMNTVKCPGCSQTFDQGVAIKAHQRTCAGLRLIGQKRINKRLQNAQIKKQTDNAQKREAAKLARLEGHSLEEIAEERQELRDELDDENLPFRVGIPLQLEEAESSMVRKNALEIYD